MIVTDDLLREFLAETGEHLDVVDADLLRLERNPGDEAVLRNVFRLVHTIKGTCGFLGLPRLEALAHAAETLMGHLRDHPSATRGAVALILTTVDRIKLIVAELDRIGAEPPGFDADLIAELERASGGAIQAAAPGDSQGPEQVLLRPLRPGEVPLPELERAFQQAPGPDGEPVRAAGQAGPVRAAAAPVARATGREETLDRSRAQTIRVGVATLDRLMSTVSELVLTRNQILDVARRMRDDAGLRAPLQRLSQVTAELQDGIMRSRMQPIGSAWGKLPRLVRDLSAELGKKIELVVAGQDTELDRQVLDVIRDPLVHMVRNSADHGIERPAERRARGKPESGSIRLNAYHEGGAITIEVSDDGRGLDYDAIRSRAAAIGLAADAEIARMSDERLAELIFRPGFSTAEAVSSVSGRGVGMDVVRSNIDLIGGAIEIASVPGRGATFKIRLPLTLAIVGALIVEAGGQRFAVPQAAIQELVRVRPGSAHVVEHIHEAAVLRLRGRLVPVIALAKVLDLTVAADPEHSFVIVMQVGRMRFGVAVEAVYETEEIVVKALATRLAAMPLFSGSTILGDGAVVLILDPNGLGRQVGTEATRGAPEPEGPDEPEPEELTTLLVFRGSDGAAKAMPLPLVGRLEEFDARQIETVAGRACIQYRGALMPLVPVDDGLTIRTTGTQPVIVVCTGAVTLGLAVDEVIDIVETPLAIAPLPGRRDLLGSAIVRGRATEILDLTAFLPFAAASPRPAEPARQVLLVEPNGFFRDLLSPVLKVAGFGVLAVSSADAALAAILSVRIDAVVAELDLGARSGLDLVETLRRNPVTAALPAVLLSSGLDDTARSRARLLDVAIVAKFDRSGLLAALAARTADAPIRELAA